VGCERIEWHGTIKGKCFLFFVFGNFFYFRGEREKKKCLKKTRCFFVGGSPPRKKNIPKKTKKKKRVTSQEPYRHVVIRQAPVAPDALCVDGGG
jgi:hypothetical protein